MTDLSREHYEKTMGWGVRQRDSVLEEFSLHPFFILEKFRFESIEIASADYERRVAAMKAEVARPIHW